jgi:hypothetical protein
MLATLLVAAWALVASVLACGLVVPSTDDRDHFGDRSPERKWCLRGSPSRPLASGKFGKISASC